MRITAKIATAGVAGLSRFPVANYTIDECTAPDGRLDPAKTRRALDVEQVQIGSKDDLRVLAFTLEYLTQQRSVVEKMAENLTRDGVPASVSSVSPDGQAVLDPARSNYRTEAATPGDRRCERNMNRVSLACAVLDADLAAVRSCDAIYLLRDWESSRGAKKELAEALAHGLKIIQEAGTP